MSDTQDLNRLLRIASLSAEYCRAVENSREYELDDFVKEMLDFLPRIYLEFSGFDPENSMLDSDMEYFPEYVDEDYYESVRRGMEILFGEHDTFLETFEEDMKYSDTPLAASISESLADIFQPLYNYIAAVKDSEGDGSLEAYINCRENFVSYWSQTLCNVLRPLNRLRYQ